MPNFGCLIRKRKFKESNVKQEKKDQKYKKQSTFSHGKLILDSKLQKTVKAKKSENKKCLKINGPMKLIKIKKLKNKDSS